MNCVLDSSLALAWLLPDETSELADKVLATVTSQKVYFGFLLCGGTKFRMPLP